MYRVSPVPNVSEALEEVKRIRKSLLTTDSITINLSQLDSITNERIRLALSSILAEREAALFRNLN